MSDLNLIVPHQLSQQEALTRIKRAITQAKAEYAGQITDFQEHWNDNSGTFNLTVKGITVPLRVEVNPSDVAVQSSLPFLVSIFQSRIEETTRQLLGRILS